MRVKKKASKKRDYPKPGQTGFLQWRKEHPRLSDTLYGKKKRSKVKVPKQKDRRLDAPFVVPAIDKQVFRMEFNPTRLIVAPRGPLRTDDVVGTIGAPPQIFDVQVEIHGQFIDVGTSDKLPNTNGLHAARLTISIRREKKKIYVRREIYGKGLRGWIQHPLISCEELLNGSR